MSEVRRGRPPKNKTETEKPEQSIPPEELSQLSRERHDPRAESVRERQRPDRVPLGVPHFKLTLVDYADQLEGYVPRWINDDGGRIQHAMKGGYEPIYQDHIKVGDGEDLNTDMGSWVSQIVGKKENGEPLRAYAMKIRKEWYDEDQKAKQAPIDAIDEAIKGGNVAKQAGDNRYVKSIQYETNRR